MIRYINDLAQLLSLISAYPVGVQGYLLALLLSMAADSNGVSVAVSQDGSPLPAPANGDLNVAVFNNLPAASAIPAGFAAAFLSGVSAGSLLVPENTLGVGSPTGAELLSGSGDDTLVSGSGNDTLTPGFGLQVIASQASQPGSASGAILLDASDQGSDTVFAFGPALVSQGASTLFFINGANSSTVDGGTGSGQEIVNGGAGGGVFSAAGLGSILYGGTGASTLTGGNFDNSVLFAGGADADVLNAGFGNATLSGIGSTGANTFNAGFGKGVLMGGGSGNETFVAGAGRVTMIGGSGADTFVFASGRAIAQDANFGGGAAEIDNFGDADKIMLQGYGPNVVQSALNNAVISSGSLTVTLPDQTTVLFQGVTHLDPSVFTT